MTFPLLLGAFLRRDAAIARSYRFALVLEFCSAVTVTLLFFFLARVVDGDSLRANGVENGEYFPFVVVGVCLLGVLDAGMLGPSSRLRSDQVNGTLEPLLVTPARAWAIVTMGPAYDILKAVGFAAATLIFAVAALGLDLEGGAGGIALAVVLLIPALAMMTGLGLLVAAMTVVVRRAESVSSFASVALGLACGVYYPIDVLPSAVQEIARLLPPTWLLDLERAALLGGDIVVWKVAGVVIAGMVTPIVGAFGLASALRRARRLGTLTHY
jgi:ABC-2 type transport system permease protein